MKRFWPLLLLIPLNAWAAATFTNTEDTGWAFAESAGSTTDPITVTLPSDSADGLLHLVMHCTDAANAAAAGNSIDIDSVSGESTIQSALNEGSAVNGGLAIWEQSGSPPASVGIDFTSSPAERKTGHVIAISDYDTGDVVSSADVTTSQGTGTAITFAASVTTAETDDLVFRGLCVDSDETISGTIGTLIDNNTAASNFSVSTYLSFETGDGTTADADSSTVTLSGSEQWISFTIVVPGEASGGNIVPITVNQQRRKRQ